ncbi:MAG TPA: hypothetical protein VFL29_12820 [Candidatus Dormibacteraeota bacterium]|nr:hypothetical protein [Candidatus Dormibacteraeota bacterium]
MGILLLKLTLTPVLIGGASLASRRWGAEVGGWLVGIPFTSGPIAFFLAVESGVHFAADASVGILAGGLSQAAFAVAYSWTALRLGRTWSVAAATVAFALATVLLNVFRSSAAVTLAMAVTSLVLALAVLPRRAAKPAAEVTLPWWDIPARMLVATVFVVALTSAAPALGPRLSGLLSPFPVYAAVLCVFAHRLQGPGAAIAVMRGLLLGLFSFAAFFAALAFLLEAEGIAIAFAIAIAATLVFQAATLAVGRRLRMA